MLPGQTGLQLSGRACQRMPYRLLAIMLNSPLQWAAIAPGCPRINADAPDGQRGT